MLQKKIKRAVAIPKGLEIMVCVIQSFLREWGINLYNIMMLTAFEIQCSMHKGTFDAFEVTEVQFLGFMVLSNYVWSTLRCDILQSGLLQL